MVTPHVDARRTAEQQSPPRRAGRRPRPWDSTLVRAVVAVAWTAGVWWSTGSVLLAVPAAGLACWVWKATVQPRSSPAADTDASPAAGGPA